MPSATLGWNRDEIVSKILDTLGRTGDSTLQSRLQEDINFAQLTFWKFYDWRWGATNGLTDGVYLTLVTGTNTYTLNTSGITVEMRNTDVSKLYMTDATFARVLIKAELRELRTWDPGKTNQQCPEFYAESGNNSIELWPKPTSTVNGLKIYVDGKRMPTFITTGAAYPDVPIEYQETFIQYLLVRALSRERNATATAELAIFKDMLKNDLQCDLKEIESNLRMKWPEEEYSIGNVTDTRDRAMWDFT